MTLQKLFFCAAIAGIAFAAEGGTYWWTGKAGDGDWSNPENFAVGTETGEVATVLPGETDDVFVPKNTTHTFEYDPSDPAKMASLNAFSGMYRIRADANTVNFYITVPAGETYALKCAIVRGANLSNYNRGHLIKRGLGELDLNSTNRYYSSGSNYDYMCSITVEEGVLKFAPEAVASKHCYFGKVTVKEGATLFTLRGNDSSDASTTIRYLYGAGTITNDYSAACRLRVLDEANFTGRITGSVYIYSGGNWRLTATDSINTYGLVIAGNDGAGVTGTSGGTFAVTSLGMKKNGDVGTPSSIGCGDTITTRDNGGALLYLGNGETTDKDLHLWPQTTPYPSYIDAGANGGIVWTGMWGHRNTTSSSFQPVMLSLVLQGSNRQECVMSGKIESRTKGGTNYTFCITKQGTGTWRMAHNNSSDMRGVWRVLDGTLRYDTIANTNINTALGLSTRLYENLGGVLAIDSNKVDYAFWLGGGEGANRANLEYVGETNCVSTTRRFAVNGEAGVLNNGGGFLRLSDFVATNTASTLVLGGTNTLDNLADCIADGGNATMSVAKEGSGTWRLGTNCTFTGALDVRDGKLVLGNPEKYTYYRWSIKESFYTNLVARDGASSQTFRLYSFGLYDKDGTDWAMNLSNEGYYTVAADRRYVTAKCVKNALYETFGASVYSGVRPGSFRLGLSEITYNGTQGFTNLFKHSASYIADWNRKNQYLIRETNTASWVVFIMRPPENANPITSWDYVNAWDTTAEVRKNQLIRVSTLEASVDGNAWDELQRIERMGWPESSDRWQSDDSQYSAPFDTHSGMPIPPGPTNDVAFAASSVSVAAGSELVAYAPTKPVIRALTVDGTAGGGRIEGFAFAPDCAVNVVNPKSGTSYEIPMALVDDEGLDGAAEWLVSVGGTPRSNFRVSASPAGLLVRPLGAQLIIR